MRAILPASERRMRDRTKDSRTDREEEGMVLEAEAVVVMVEADGQAGSVKAAEASDETDGLQRNHRH
jgi:hypothetical protein